MAIVFRNLTDLTVNGMTARLTVSAAGGKLKVTLEPYNSATTTAYTKGAQVEVTYNGEGQTLVSSPFTSAVTAVFVQAAEVKSLTLSSASTLTYEGTSSTSLTISWKGDGSVAAPALSIASYSGLMIGQASRIVWQFDDVPEGYFVRTVGLWFHYAESTGRAPSYTRTAIFTEKRLDTVYEHTVADLETNNVIFYRIAAAVYESDADALNDYVAYTEIDSSPYVCSGDSVYTLAPVNLRYRPVRNVPFTIRWELLP
ncbi:MAG: hypothetical protein ACI4V1_07115, partial [Eubacteriales bacterium]